MKTVIDANKGNVFRKGINVFAIHFGIGPASGVGATFSVIVCVLYAILYINAVTEKPLIDATILLPGLILISIQSTICRN